MWKTIAHTENADKFDKLWHPIPKQLQSTKPHKNPESFQFSNTQKQNVTTMRHESQQRRTLETSLNEKYEWNKEQIERIWSNKTSPAWWWKVDN